MVKIGQVELREQPLFLAPMEDVTDPSFRYICKQFGADFVYTEFISSDGLIRNGKKSLKKLDIYEYERPIGIQLYGHLLEPMVEAAKIAEESKPEIIDINFGCPVRKIANRGAGAGMLRNIPLMMEMTEAIIKATNIPVTVKTRLGWDEDSKNVLDVALQLQDIGVQALTIHGRTRNQMYKGKADWTLIGEVKNHPRIHIPIIGNGDVTSPEIAKNMFETYGVDGIMIGRPTVGRPWIFKEIRHFLDTGNLLQPLSLKEKVELAKLHFTKSIEFKGEPRGVYEMRRHFSNYFKGLPNFKGIRIKLLTTIDPKEIFSILDLINEKYLNFEMNEDNKSQSDTIS
ncbi:MAG: tRNA dihydrouridine synthase DusB [Bacteroidales bacterium]|nr:tRNA dihydrouridine synthase DusB [Bacteroidales bacterium]